MHFTQYLYPTFLDTDARHNVYSEMLCYEYWLTSITTLTLKSSKKVNLKIVVLLIVAQFLIFAAAMIPAVGKNDHFVLNPLYLIT